MSRPVVELGGAWRLGPNNLFNPTPSDQLIKRTGAGPCPGKLHNELSIGAANGLGAGANAVIVERRSTAEGDRVGDQLRALRTTGRAAGRI